MIVVEGAETVAVGSGVGGTVGSDDVERVGRREERSLSFRLETGRSPKSRKHLTEGRQGIQEMFKW